MSGEADRHVLDLSDYALANLDGFTNVDAMDALGWSLPTFNQTLRRLRLYLGHFDDINLTCDPPGDGGKWIYRLVGTLEEMRPWSVNRLHDTETRLRTQEAMMAPIVRATDGRTTDGKVARVTEKALRRLVEDIDEIRLNGAP